MPEEPAAPNGAAANDNPVPEKSLMDYVHPVDLPGDGGVAFYAAPGTDLEWAGAVKADLLSLPAVFRSIAADAGTKFVLGHRPPDIGITGDTPRQDDFYKRADIEVGGFYSPVFKAVGMTEERYNRDWGTYIKARKTKQVAAHEFGHALDDILKISESPEAQAAFRLERLTVASYLKPALGYLLQPAPHGPQECVAEIASHIWTGQAINTSVNDLNVTYFATWLRGYFYHMEKYYDPAKGITDTLTETAANFAEMAMLYSRMANERILHELLESIECDPRHPWQKFRKSSWLTNQFISQEERGKRDIFLEIAARQGRVAVSHAIERCENELRKLPRLSL